MNEVFTPLMLAVIGNHINVVNILIQSGVDIHVGYRSTTDRRIPRTHEYNTTLAISAFMARWGLYKYKYNTALTLAREMGRAPIYRLLRSAGAEDPPRDPCGFISFDMGCQDSLDMLGEDNIRNAINHLKLYLHAKNLYARG